MFWAAAAASGAMAPIAKATVASLRLNGLGDRLNPKRDRGPLGPGKSVRPCEVT
jgi:hypothetical protein